MHNSEDLLIIIYYLSSSFSLVPLAITLFRIKLIDRRLYPIVLLVYTATLVEIVCITHSVFGINNFYIFRIYTIIEFVLISFFYILFFKPYFKPLIFRFFLLLFLIVALLDLRINGFVNIDDFSSSVSSILLTCYSLFLFYFILKHLLIETLLSSPIFWINSAVLFYFSGNLFLFTFSGTLVKLGGDNYNFFWGTIHSFFNISYNILLAVALWKTKTK